MKHVSVQLIHFKRVGSLEPFMIQASLEVLRNRVIANDKAPGQQNKRSNLIYLSKWLK